MKVFKAINAHDRRSLIVELIQAGGNEEEPHFSHLKFLSPPASWTVTPTWAMFGEMRDTAAARVGRSGRAAGAKASARDAAPMSATTLALTMEAIVNEI